MSENLAGGSGAASMTAPDHRREPRLRSLLPGKIVLDDKCTMDCTVRNISACGAKVVVADAYRLPEEFSLRIPHHKQTAPRGGRLAERRCGRLRAFRYR